MGNYNSSSLISQHEKPDMDLSAPILEKEQLHKANNSESPQNKARSRRMSNGKHESGNKKCKIEKKKIKLNDMIFNPQHMLPKEFSSLEDLKNIHLAQKQKKKEKGKEESFSEEWYLTVFGGGRVTYFVVTDDSKYLISGTDKGFISSFELETKTLIGCVQADNKESFNSVSMSKYCQKFAVIAMNDVLPLYGSYGPRVTLFDEGHDYPAPPSSILVSESYFIIGSSDGSIYVNSSEDIYLGKVHEGPVSSLTLTNDKAYLISASLDRCIKIFDVNGWKELHHFVGVHEDIICSVIVSHDDQYLITGSKDRSVKVFDLRNKQEIIHFKEIYEEGVMSVAISRDNKHIYCTAGLSIKILSLEARQEVSELKNLHSDSIISIALSKNGKYLISAALDCSIMILNNETQEKSYLKDIQTSKFVVIGANNYPIEPIISLAISADNKYVVSGSSEGIKVFDFEKRNKTPLYVVDCEGETVHSLVISSRNKYLLSGCTKSIRLFEFSGMKQIFEFPVSEGDILYIYYPLTSTTGKNYPIAISDYEEFIVFRSSRSSVKIFWLKDSEEGEVSFESEVVSIRLYSNDFCIIVGLSDNSIKTIEFEYYHRIREFFKSTVQGDLLFQSNCNHFKGALQTSNDGKHVLILDYKKGSISIFDLLTKQLISELNLENQISLMALSGDSKNVIVARDSGIQVFDLAGTFLGRSWDSHSRNIVLLNYSNSRKVTALTVSEDNQYIVSGLENGILRVRRFGRKKQVYELVPDPKERDSVKYTAIWEEFGWIILAYRDFSIKIFDIDTKLEVDCIKVQERDKIKACAVQRNGPNVVFVFEGGKLKVLNLIMKQEQDWGNINVKENIDAFAISNDGQFLAIAVDSQLIIVLDFYTKQEKCKIALNDSVRSLHISNQNKYFFLSRKELIEVYDLCAGQLIAHFRRHSYYEKVAVSNDNRYLISGSRDDGSVNIFDIETQNDIFTVKMEAGFIEKETSRLIEISNDDKYILAALPRTIKIFDRLTKKELEKFRNLGYLSISRYPNDDSVESKLVISQSKMYTLVGTCLLSPFYNKPDEIFYISSKISIDSLFATKYDDFLTSLSPEIKSEEKKRFFQSCQDMIIIPYHWSALHLLAIMNPSGISQISEYSQFKISSLLDSYGKTPLHYLLAQKNRDYAIINIMLNYIIDYLQDKQRMTAHEHEQICHSLSNCFFFIVSKVTTSVSQEFLALCYPETYLLSKQVLPSFGLPDQNYTFSKVPYLKQEVLNKLYREGNDRIIFRTNMIYFDYDPRSDDMLMTVHTLYKHEQPIIFKIPFIENLIDHLWETTLTTLHLTALAFSTFMILLSLYIGLEQESFVFEINILFLTILFFISELIQMVTLGKEYLQSVWNWIDFVQLLLTFIFICSKIADAEVRGEAWIVSTIIMTGYLRWLSYLRLFSPTRILIEIILAVMYDMIGFIAVIASILIGFSLIFLEFGRNHPYPQEYSFHLYSTFKLLFGDYDDTDFSLSQTILVAFLMCVLNVVLLNLLISIIGNTFSKVQECRDIIDAKTRLEMIREAIIVMRAIKPKKTVNRGYLIYKLPATIEEGKLKSREWEARINQMAKLLKENNHEEQKNMKNEIKNSEAQVIARMKSEIDTMKNEIKNSEAHVVDYMKTLETKVFDMKNEVNTIKDEIKGEVKHIQEQVQGLKELVNLVLTHLNQVPKKNE